MDQPIPTKAQLHIWLVPHAAKTVQMSERNSKPASVLLFL